MAKQKERKSSGDNQGKPNILVICGDDIGIWNLSCYSHGTMAYRTPNIDRIAKEGMMFTDSYGEQACAAGIPTLERPVRKTLCPVIKAARPAVHDCSPYESVNIIPSLAMRSMLGVR